MHTLINNLYFIILYISTLFKQVLYADYTNIMFISDTISDLSESMNSELKKLSSWLAINKLTLNIDKCMYIFFNVGESNRIRTVTEYGQYRYLMNHKSYKTKL